MADTKFPKSVIIVGGSLAGLIHGLYLKRHGVDVTILEQDPGATRRSHNAGIAFGPAVGEILSKYDDTGIESFIPTVGTRIAWRRYKDVKRINARHRETSWEMLYYILRANFDGLVPGIVAVPPPRRAGDGNCQYLVGARVAGLVFAGDEGVGGGGGGESPVSVRYIRSVSDADGGNREESRQEETVGADLVIGADGRHSTIRDLAVGAATKVEYAGYVSWRGTVPEKDVLPETAKYFENMTSTNMVKRGYLVVYLIPSASGSLAPGDRLINWVWYYNLAEGSPELQQTLTDTNGHLHSNTVPVGLVRPEVWQKHLSTALSNMAGPFADILSKTQTQNLFVTKVTDALSTKASFRDGRVLLVGDALAAFRPHLAVATEQAAKHCLGLGEVWEGRKTIEQWEREVTVTGQRLWLASRLLGAFGCRPWLEFWGSMLRDIAFLVRLKIGGAH